ncbi:MAG TPA: class I SAM-dependent methyltransferase [Thermoleophilaceae bacterium]
MSFYPADLARIHDESYGDFARAATCEVHRHLPPSGVVVELGCGTGISTQILVRLGYGVLGIDISADMLAIARSRAPTAEFRQGSIWDAEIPPCAGVTAIGEVVNYAADERAGMEHLPELFERVQAALQPGGAFVFDFATPGRASARPHDAEGDGWRLHSTTVERDGVLERRIRIETDAGVREEVHRLRLYDASVVGDLLLAAGFAAQRLERYCDFEFWPGYAAYAARSAG